jgi:hypothetical protein
MLSKAYRRADNAKRARALADREFPDEKWIRVEDGIYLSPRRPVGVKSNYSYERRDAQILRDLGSTVYLVPEVRSDRAKKYDAIVDNLKVEFKNVRGSAVSTVQEQFLTSRSQAPNVFINLEESVLAEKDVITALYGARNNERYERKNKFLGGMVILKTKGRESLVYLTIDELEQNEQ